MPPKRSEPHIVGFRRGLSHLRCHLDHIPLQQRVFALLRDLLSYLQEILDSFLELASSSFAFH